MILHFNPGHETAVLNGSPYYMAPSNVVAMQHELAFLPAWYGNSNDVILIPEPDSTEYYSFLYKNFPSLPQAVSPNQLPDYPHAKICLWGISPQAIHFFEELNTEYAIDLQIPEWKEEYRYMNSREAAKDCLTQLIDSIESISEKLIPELFTDLGAIENEVKASPTRLLAKAPYSSSGRGLLWLPISGLTRTERQILQGILNKQGTVSIERVIDKQVDFAMEFLVDGEGKITFEGYSLFHTNKKGAYISNYLGTQQSIEQHLSSKISIDLLEEIKEKLLLMLANKYASVYKGCIGVDMMIYTENDEYKLHPCVEINMRYNMGYLCVKLFENYISPASHGKFHIDFSPREGEIYHQHLTMEERHPLQIINNKISKGYLPLCPVEQNSRYRAYIIME